MYATERGKQDRAHSRLDIYYTSWIASIRAAFTIDSNPPCWPKKRLETFMQWNLHAVWRRFFKHLPHASPVDRLICEALNLKITLYVDIQPLSHLYVVVPLGPLLNLIFLKFRSLGVDTARLIWRIFRLFKIWLFESWARQDTFTK